MLYVCRLLRPGQLNVVIPAAQFSVGRVIKIENQLPVNKIVEKPKKRRKKQGASSGVISVLEDGGLKETKARVIKLKGDQLDLLGSNTSSTNMLPSPRHTCTSCGRSYVHAKSLKAHLKKHPYCHTVHTQSINQAQTSELSKTDESNSVTPETSYPLLPLDSSTSMSETLKTTPSLDQLPKSMPSMTESTESTPDSNINPVKLTKKLEVEDKKAKLFNEKRERLVELHVVKQRDVLLSYFDTLIMTGKVDQAYSEFKSIRNNPDGHKYVSYITVYDQFLRGFARRRDFAKLQEVWKELSSKNMKPSIESFISAFVCLGNVDQSKQVFKTILSQVYKDFLVNEYSINEALKSNNFLFDDKDMFLRSISIVVEDTNLLDIKSGTETTNPLIHEVRTMGSGTLKSQVHDVIERKELDDCVTRQLDIEMSRTVRVSSICQVNDEKTIESFRAATEKLENNWRNKLISAIDTKLESRKKLTSFLRGNTVNMRQFLSCLSTPSLSDIVLTQAKNIIVNSETYSPPLNHIIRSLGEEVMNTYHLTSKTEYDKYHWNKFTAGLSSYLDWYCQPEMTNHREMNNHREAIQEATKSFSLDRNFVDWSPSVQSSIGSELFSFMLREITIDKDAEGNVVIDNMVFGMDGQTKSPVLPITTCPAFFKIFRVRKGSQEVEEVKPHPSLSRLYDVNRMVDFHFSSAELPMVCPPLPWVSSRTGGYLINRSKLIRRAVDQTSTEQEDMINKMPSSQLDPVLDSINQLSGVPWRVNKPQLEMAINVFLNQSDISLLNATSLPRHPDNIICPSLNDELQSVLNTGGRLDQDQVKEYQNFLNTKSVYGQVKAENYSLWCDVLYRLSQANHYKDQVIWFPHNIDFRGRCYPLPVLFNHMGADLARSLLLFAQGKPLGSEGLKWLKLHCINLTGLKKRESIEDRLVYADEILDDILDSAERPLEGKRWWLESDDPWQTLSVCREIKLALDHPDGPDQYVSHLPIHQDGSCNGLQHYAAIGRDRLGAQAVNLVPADVPQDVYSEIAAIVERKRSKDGAKGLEIANELEDFVKRKVVKQTVMTTVYGVTMFGAVKQIARQLKDMESFPLEHVDSGSKYLSKKTFESLNEMFTASQEIQDWLTECAKVIAGECSSNVSWITPMGLPVVQPYFRLHTAREKSLGMDVQNLFKVGTMAEPVKKINTVKHRNGFPPNFIHSLDSSHMMLTSLHLWSRGITFASVHDCYWSHAVDVSSMNQVCRDQFVALHSFPILESLSQYFLDNFMEHPSFETMSAKKKNGMELELKKREILFKNVPKKGSLDLNVVRDSIYFFS